MINDKIKGWCPGEDGASSLASAVYTSANRNLFALSLPLFCLAAILISPFGLTLYAIYDLIKGD